MSPRSHATPADAVRERVRETVIVAGQSFRLERPSDTDHLFDHPAVRAAYGADEYVPYWAELWPAARMLAKALLAEPWETLPGQPLTALEIGCGLGLAGIVALSRGLQVTFSDLDELAVEFAAGNARLNGFRTFETAAIDLRFPPPRQFSVILGSDLMYDPHMAETLPRFLADALAPDGLALIADPDREAAKPFRHFLWKAGLRATSTFARAGVPGGERTKGTIYRITR